MTYDIANRNEPTQIYIARVDKVPLYCLNLGVDEDTCTITKNLNNTAELTFTIYKEIDGELVDGYELVQELMLIYASGIGWFKINSTPEITFDGYKESKEVTAESVEIELQGYDIVGIDINTAAANSLEMLIQGNVDEDTGIPKKPISLYYKNDKEYSLLDFLIDEYIPWWHIEHIDPTLIDDDNTSEDGKHVMYFSIDNQDLYSFMTQTLAQAFQCLFIFDYDTYGISVYDPKLLGADTNIYIGYRNVQDSVNIVADTEDLYTSINVSGGEGLDNINYVNYGSSTLENIDYYLNENYLSTSAIAGYKAWREVYEANRAEYGTLTVSYNEKLKQSTEVQNRVPNDGADTKWSDWSNEDLLTAKSDYEAQIKGYEKLYVNDNNEFDVNILKQYPAEYADYISIKDTVIPNIDIAIKNLGLIDDDKIDYLTAFETDWELYGVDELNSKLQVYKNALDAYAEYKDAYNSSKTGHSKEYYTEMHNYYLEQEKYYNACTEAYNQRKAEYDSIIAEMNEIDEKRKALIDKVKKSHYLTDDELIAIKKLYRNTDYTNDNIIVTNLDTPKSEVGKAEELYQDALEQLSSLAQPQYSYTTNIENILALSEYEYETKQLELGNFIHVELEDGKYVKLRVSQISYNPMTYNNSFTLSFTNMVQYRSKRNDFSSLISRNNGTSKNSITSNASSNNGSADTTVSIALLQKIINSSYFKNNVGSYTSSGLASYKADIDGIVSNYVKTDELEAKVANIHELNADSAFIKYLNANYLTADTIIADEALIEKLEARFANIDFSNITDAVIDGAIIKNNTVDTTNIKDGAITNAKILNLDAGKITAGKILTDNITIGDNTNNLLINNSTIQINDDKRVRVQIGKDASEDYNMYVFDKNGKVMFDATGVHADGIKSPIIVNNMISSDAAITSDKLDMHSLVYSLENGTEKLTTNSITYDGESLSLKFGEMASTVGEMNNKYSAITDDLEGLRTEMGKALTQEGLSKTLGDYATISALTSSIQQTEKDINTSITETLKTYPTSQDVTNTLADYYTIENTKEQLKQSKEEILGVVSGNYIAKATFNDDIDEKLKSYDSSAIVDSKIKASKEAIESSMSTNYTTTTQFTTAVGQLNNKIDGINVNPDGTVGVSLASLEILYCISDSRTEAPTGYDQMPPINGWSTDSPFLEVSVPYVWSVTRVTYTNDTRTYSKPVCISGKDGNAGKGIISMDTEYALGDSSTEHPTDGWSIEFESVYSGWETGKYIWTRQNVLYTDLSQDYINYICDTSWLLFDNIVVGARNILTRAERNFITGWIDRPLDLISSVHHSDEDNNIVFSSAVNQYEHEYKICTLKRGQEYTFSFDYAVTESPKAGSIYLIISAITPDITSNNINNCIRKLVLDVPSGTKEAKRYSVTFKAEATTYIDFSFGDLPKGLQYGFTFSNLQLEVGNVATDFKLAESDIVSDAVVKADENVQEVLKSYTTTTDVANQITQNQGTILEEVKNKYTSKADYELVSRGLNKWLLYTFEDTSITTTSTASVTNTYGKIPSNIYEIANTDISTGTDAGSKYYGRVLTNVYFTNEYTWKTTFTCNDKNLLYLNSTLIKSSSVGGKVAVTLPFHKGWNVIEMICTHPSGNIAFGFGTSVLDLEACNMMNCYASFTNEATASFKLTSDTIASKVDVNGVISSINQSSETISINASKIDLSGYVKISSLAEKGSTIINGSNITTGLIDASRIDVKGDLTAFGATIAGWKISDRYIEKYINYWGKTYHSVIECLSSTPSNYFIWEQVGSYDDNGNWVTDYTPWKVRHDGYMKFESSDHYSTMEISSGRLAITSLVSDFFKDGEYVTDTIEFADGDINISSNETYSKFSAKIGGSGLSYTDGNGNKIFEIPLNHFFNYDPIACYKSFYAKDGVYFNSDCMGIMPDQYGIYKAGTNTRVIGKYVSFNAYSNKTNTLTFNGECFRPDSTSDVIQLGYSSNRFTYGYFNKAVYAAGGFKESSDRKVKENISTIDSEWAVDFINKLNPCFFTFKVSANHTGKRTQMGMIAQDVHKISVEMDKDLAIYEADIKPSDETDAEANWTDYNDSMDVDDENLDWNLKYTQFIAPMISVLQSQQKTITKLNERLESLENKKG